MIACFISLSTPELQYILLCLQALGTLQLKRKVYFNSAFFRCIFYMLSVNISLNIYLENRNVILVFNRFRKEIILFSLYPIRAVKEETCFKTIIPCFSSKLLILPQLFESVVQHLLVQRVLMLFLLIGDLEASRCLKSLQMVIAAMK